MKGKNLLDNTENDLHHPSIHTDKQMLKQLEDEADEGWIQKRRAKRARELKGILKDSSIKITRSNSADILSNLDSRNQSKPLP